MPRSYLTMTALPRPLRDQIRLLLGRLERLSADSYWAHRASGLRGSLLNILDQDSRGEVQALDEVEGMVRAAFDVLENAAREKGPHPPTAS